jgi:divalent metal cation (Fe/Co/Zn/Cd) transporter
MAQDCCTDDRTLTVQRGRTLEYFTLLWCSLEALVGITFGALAGSVALVGFGFDSVIEVSSGAALLWRLGLDDTARREHAEKLTLKIIGVLFLGLAAYVAYDSLKSLFRHEAPAESLVGIGLAAVSLVVMPLLARAKRKVAAGIQSAAMNADARQAQFCTYLSAILLVGLLVNALFGWWWADPAAALVMVPIISKEGIDALAGKSCSDCGCP